MTDHKPGVDEATGTSFVGHEWDGIQELDTPLPRWWVYIFAATVVFAAGYVVAYPAAPDTDGLTGWSSHRQLAETLTAEAAARAPRLNAIAATPIEQLPANPALMRSAIEGGRAAFKVNCVQCHGAGAAGSKGYPNLNDDDWLWGGDIASIHTTISKGVRNPDVDDTRFSQMPAFADILSKGQIQQLVSHVRAISGQGKPSPAGAALFAENCASCHGPDGKGMREQGAPNLTDGIWLYGGDRATLTETIAKARYGVMPHWAGRLDPVTIKMLAAYVHSLGGGEANPPPPPIATAGGANVGP
ncbi:cytochrome-c oxidase, cbb3-type subunit III [Sandarakinorhabdus oryzae]|uniref:cytochrome-c oxidase, cbb3-type subunit III n=1 Tax=Sandarakinorhabdus oryzae TaxID=2675220 RepID=UPI0012E1CABB|nr:cytochrome-c oxidase, cbb3-type subunit III [Sandarakinorhabdus oryzae]